MKDRERKKQRERERKGERERERAKEEVCAAVTRTREHPKTPN